jgi:hypothetical protein
MDDNGKLVARTKPTTVEFTADNRFDGFDFIVLFPGFDLPRAGTYEFSLCANYVDKPLSTATIRYLKEM